MKPIQFLLAAGVLCVFTQCSKNNAANSKSATQSSLILASDSYSESSPANIYAVKPDGTGTCYVTNDGDWNRNAGWSYDGSKIVYEVRNRFGGIWTMDANGDNKKQLTFLPTRAFGPAFSPDGNHIVYADYGAGEVDTGLVGIEVWVMNADGTGNRQLTKTTVSGLTRTGINIRWACRPAYSPDGTKIVYACTQSGRSEIWVMNADGTDQRQFTYPGYPAAPDANFPSYSPDGTKIVFLGGYETEYGNIWVMNADSTKRTQLTLEPDSISSDEPAWSPDGKSIMFNSNRYDPNLGRRAEQTWVMNADGSNPRVLFPHLYGEGRNPWRNDPVHAGGPTFQCKH
jgi:Tol biopolymer transport system component